MYIIKCGDKYLKWNNRSNAGKPIQVDIIQATKIKTKYIAKMTIKELQQDGYTEGELSCEEIVE